MPSSRDRATVLGAYLEGWRRAMAAPRIVLGVWVLTWIAALPLAMRAGQAARADLSALAPDTLGFGGTLAIVSRFVDGDPLPSSLVAAVVVYVAAWIFLSGGILDRYARARAVPARAFFAACGVFFLRFLRLAVVIGPAYWLVFRAIVPWLAGPAFDWGVRHLSTEHRALVWRGVLYGVELALLAAISLLADVAKVRLVVEDRHSALAALPAAWRFIRRRAARMIGLYLLNIVGLLAIARLWLQIAPSASDAHWLALLTTQVYLVARIWAKLAFMASEVVFFQGDLAHAQYSATPDPVWPDSPPADARISP